MTSSKHSPHKLITTTDPSGNEIVGVALSNVPKVAWINKDDYEAFVAQNGTPAWFLAHNGKGTSYVRFKDGKTGYVRTVARELTGRNARTAISYANCDTLDLRASNLLVSSGHGGVSKRRKSTRRAPSTTREAYPQRLAL